MNLRNWLGVGPARGGQQERAEREGEGSIGPMIGGILMVAIDRGPSYPEWTMNTVTLHLSEDTEQKLRDKSQKLGQTLESYLEQLAETAVETTIIAGPAYRNAHGTTQVGNDSRVAPKLVLRPKFTADELENLLDEFSAGPSGKILPADFSRADIYDDHD